MLQRKNHEEGFIQIEEKYQDIFFHSPIGIELYDVDGKLIEVNPACLNIFGVRSIEDVRGFDLFQDPNLPVDARERLLRGETVSYEAAFDFERVKQMDLYPTDKSGQRFIDVHIHTFQGVGERPGGFLVYVKDITERTRTLEELEKYRDQLFEQKIQRSAEEWQTTFDSIQNPIMVLDPECRILRINAATRSFLGLPDDQILGACCHELVHGTDGCIPECPVRTTLTSKHHEEKEIYEPGRGIWFHVTADPLLGPPGNLIGIVHTLKDITPRRKAEEDLQKLQEELRRVTRIATMGELTAALAHELNQPLTGILSNAEAAQHLLSAPNPDITELKEILSDIIEDDQRASKVISKLRSLFKKDVLNFEPLDLNAVIQDLAPMIRSYALLKGVVFLIEPDPKNLPVVGDRIQLQQVMLNLAFNGFEAMEPSAIKTLRIRTGRTDGKWVTVHVEDSGPGINPNEKEEIFKPFFTTKKDGMGIGLAVSHSIILLHQGRIWIENNPDGGATVSFTLPLANERLE